MPGGDSGGPAPAAAAAGPTPATPERERCSAELRLGARWLTRATVALAAVYALLFLYHAGLTAAFPYDLDWGEGYVLNDAARLARGEQIYVNLQQFPMVRSPYPPLFLALDAALMQVLGVGFLAGRLLSAVSALVAAGLAGRLARLGGAAALPAVVAGLVVLASPHVYQWAPYSRVDMLAVALELAALGLASGTPGRQRLVLAGLAALAALLTKQTALAAPLGIAVSLVSHRPRDLGWFLLGLAPLGLALTGLLAWQSDGQYIRHVLTGNAGNPTNLARLVRFQLEFSLVHPLLLVGGLAAAIESLRSRRPTPLAAATLGAWLLSFSVANETSSVNYFLEVVPLAAASAAVGWTSLARRGAERAFLSAGLAVLQMALLFHVPNTVGVWPSFFPPHGYTPTAGDWEVGRQLDAEVVATAGDVLAEPAGFAVRSGRAVLVQPLDLRAEQLRGRWDSTPLREAIRAHRFEVVILSFGLFPEDVLAELRRDYSLQRTFQSPNGLRYSVYRPRS